MVRPHLFTKIFWKRLFKDCFIEELKLKNYFLNEFEVFHIEENTKFLIDDEYSYYIYWYPFFAKKIEKRVYSEDAELFLNTTIIQQKFLGDLMYSYIEVFIPEIKRQKLVVQKDLTNLLTYYYYYCSLESHKTTWNDITNFNKYTLVTLDIRSQKPKIHFIINEKNVLSVTAGMVLKKLEIKEKNFKKQNRVLNVMVKSSFNKIIKENNGEYFMLNIKGTKKVLFKLIIFLKTFFDLNKFILLYSPNISRNKIKFKKIKSIKRSLTKKNMKFFK